MSHPPLAHDRTAPPPTTSRTSAESTLISLARGDGTFAPASAEGTVPGSNLKDWSLTTGDFDGDGKTDPLVLDLSAGGWSYLLSLATGGTSTIACEGP
jgi:hypothetical protein